MRVFMPHRGDERIRTAVGVKPSDSRNFVAHSLGVELLTYASLAACVAAVLAGHELALLGLVGAVVVGVRR